MSFIMVDVETDGEIPGDYSMIELGAVIVRRGENWQDTSKLKYTFHGKLAPISDHWNDEALKISGHTREETLLFDHPAIVMTAFGQWVEKHNVGKRPMFIADNNGFDWSFVNWYFHHFLGRNPFGHSSTNLGSLYKGLVKDMRQNFKHLRVTRHTHNPVDDAMGNAEALLNMAERSGLKITLE
jgi:DNA polymerase III epsilon subunit-like protein